MQEKIKGVEQDGGRGAWCKALGEPGDGRPHVVGYRNVEIFIRLAPKGSNLRPSHRMEAWIVVNV